MKKLITAFTIYSALATTPAAFAGNEPSDLEQRMNQTVAQTVVRIGEMEIKPPFVELEQRMSMQVTDEFVDSLRPFARNLNARLERVINSAAELPKAEAEDFIIRSLQTIINGQEVRIREMLSFEILERALLIHQEIENMSDDREVGVIDMRIRLLTRAIDLAANKYAAEDLRYFNRVGAIDYAEFGTEYFNYLNDLNKSVFDADIQYYIEKLSLRFFQYDLARSVNYESYATQIVEIYDSLPSYPDQVGSDQSALRYIRSLRRLRKSL